MQLAKCALMLDLIARATLVAYLNKPLALRLKNADISPKIFFFYFANALNMLVY